MPRKQRRQKLEFDNLDAVLKSSPDAKTKGTQQFETPTEIAEALCVALNPRRPVIFDPQCGGGTLIRAAAVTGRYETHSALGIDIDPTATIPEWPSRFMVSSKVIHGDFTRILPLLLQVKTRFDLIVANPPFSLRWNLEPFNWRPVNGSVEPTPPLTPQKPVLIHSTLATFEAVNALLSKRGEGMLICNGATCDKLLAPHALYQRVWLRLNLPNFFPGTIQKMQIAVLYFAASHKGNGPLVLDTPDAMPDTIRRMLEYPSKNRDTLIRGDIVRTSNDSIMVSGNRFSAAEEEWKRVTDAEYAALNGWNIRLAKDGSIVTHLTPFQSFAGNVPEILVQALQSIHGKHPTALVVQVASRRALTLATKGNIWRVHPDVITTVDAALLEYNRVRAPLRPLNTVQRLGHLDEEDTIKCQTPPSMGFTAGKTYPIESETFEGRKVEQRKHWRKKGEEEEVLVTGQELLLRIKDDNDEWHAFTQYALGAAQEKVRPEMHFHILSELVECFEIPAVMDVGQLHQDDFEMFRARLLLLQTA